MELCIYNRADISDSIHLNENTGSKLTENMDDILQALKNTVYSIRDNVKTHIKMYMERQIKPHAEMCIEAYRKPHAKMCVEAYTKICMKPHAETHMKTQVHKSVTSAKTDTADDCSLVSSEGLSDVSARAGQILDIYGNTLLRVAYTYLHNMSDAEDIVQDTLIKYMSAAPQFESSTHEKAWLIRVAANLSKNRIDYNKIRETDELNETLQGEEREDLNFVWDAVKSLPQKYREVIHLFHYEGYSTAQIADILGRREATIRSDLRRGRMKLKQILKEEYDFE